MRFMVITKANEDCEAGVMPSEHLVTEMGKFIEELVNAGVLLAADGLQPSSNGARIHFDGDKRTVVDGPFTETKELIAGYYLVETKSLEECVEWLKRCPTRPRADATSRSAGSSRPRTSARTFTAEQQEAVSSARAQAEGNAWPACVRSRGGTGVH